MKPEKLLYEGKTKLIFETNDYNVVLIRYKNSITASNGERKDELIGKGYYNNEISSLVFKLLTKNGISNHFIKQVSENEILATKLNIIPLEVVVRNIIAGSLSKRLGLKEGILLQKPIIEFYYKNDDLKDPLITEEHIDILNIATVEKVENIKQLAINVNKVLEPMFLNCNMLLVDFKLEFGLRSDGKIILADEVSPDTSRIWDINTKKRLDKDNYRRNLGNVIDAYKEVFKRLKKGDEKCIK